MPPKYWDKFYKRHQDKFFKNRHYLEKVWGCFFPQDHLSPNGKVVLEVGFGSGSTVYPLMAAFLDIYLHACDFSSQANSLLKSNMNFREDRVNAFVSDVTHEDLCDNVDPFSVDVVTLVFMLSAVSPSKMPVILQNIRGVIKQNGYVLLRDYAVGDFAQVKLQKKDRMIGEDFYVRGVGTVRILYCPSINILTLRDHIVCITRFMMEFVYMHQCSFYFSEEFLSTLFLRAGFTTVDMNTYCRRAYNCSRNVTMDRYSPRRPVLDEAGCIMHIPRLYLKERYRNFKS